MTGYAVQISSKFAVFDDDDEDVEDPFDIIDKTRQKLEADKLEKLKQKKESDKKIKADAKKTESASASQTSQVRSTEAKSSKAAVAKQTEGNSLPAQQNQRGGRRGGTQTRISGENRQAPAKHNEAEDREAVSQPAGSAPQRGARVGANGGRGRGRGGARGNQHHNLDRHSGSDKAGVKPVEKRQGGGAHNWGNPSDPKDVVEETSENEQKEDVKEQREEQVPATEVEAEPEIDKTITLEEYLNSNTTERDRIIYGGARSNAKSTRKPNEGQDPFLEMQAYRKPPTRAEESDEESDDETAAAKKRTVLDIKLNSGFRGGRGGFRGRDTRVYRGGRDMRRSRGKHVDLRLDDEAAFPALGQVN